MRRLLQSLVYCAALLSAATSSAATPLLLYKMDQASSGTTPTTINDTSTGTAVNLTATYSTGSWTSITAGDGRTYATTGDGSTSSLASTKVSTALSGATNLSWEAVVDTTGDPNGAPLVSIYFTTGVRNLFVLTTVSAASNGGTSAVAIDYDDTYGAFCPMTNGLHYLLVTADTTQLVSTVRFNCYVDGVLATLTSATYPPQNTAYDAVISANYANIRIGIGCLGGGQTGTTNPGPKVYEAILYASTLSALTAVAHSSSMLANNDADPNAGGGAVVYDPFFFGGGP